MKLNRFITPFLCVLFASPAFCQTTTADKELSTLTETLASRIKSKGKKKITVADFTDLQGSASELGRYVAEQLTVDLVSGDREFSVLDRANLKSILAEHNLTAQGLVNPETAKKVGQFAGVDAIILGTIVPTETSVQMTAKIITTDTAEIIGAGKSTFPKSKEIQELLEHGLAGAGGNGSSETPNKPSSNEFTTTNLVQRFRNFRVELLSFRVLPNWTGFAAVQIVNTTKQDVISVGVSTMGIPGTSSLDSIVSATISDEFGNNLRCSSVSGLFPIWPHNLGVTSGFAWVQDARKNNDYKWVDKMTDINPGESVTFTLEFAHLKEQNQNQPQSRPKLGTIFKLQTELITFIKRDGDDRPNPKLENIFIDKIVPTKPPNGEKTN